MAQAKANKQPNFLIIWGDDIGQSNLSVFTYSDLSLDQGPRLIPHPHRYVCVSESL
jgi:hypothetical protein